MIDDPETQAINVLRETADQISDRVLVMWNLLQQVIDAASTYSDNLADIIGDDDTMDDTTSHDIIRFIGDRYDEIEAKENKSRRDLNNGEPCPRCGKPVDQTAYSGAGNDRGSLWWITHYDGSECDIEHADLPPSPDETVLADLASKRAILAMHQTEGTRTDYASDDLDDVTYCVCTYNEPCPTVRYLAAPFSDHPDYETEWEPRSTPK